MTPLNQIPGRGLDPAGKPDQPNQSGASPAVAPSHEPRAPWSAWPREFGAFLAVSPGWWIGPLVCIVLVLALLRLLGPDVDAPFVYSLF
jgi:Family of unknown function (DUF5989)